MKRIHQIALSAVLSLGIVASAAAQTAFPDVKDAHWAADSVNRLKLEGLIQGDSDGNFNGHRTMTRYEVASIVYAVYKKLVGFNDGIDKSLKSLESRINNVKIPANEGGQDLTDIKTAIADIQKEVGTMKSWSSDLAQLKRMVVAYSNDLKSLGADVNQMKQQITDVAARVAKLENAKAGPTISGDFNFWMASASASNGTPVVINQDGQGLPSQSTGGGFDNLTILHEFGLKIQDPTAPVPYKAELVAQTTSAFNPSLVFNGPIIQDPFGAPAEHIYLHEATATYRPANLTVGRQGMHLNRYIFSKPDSTSFYSNERWDDHNYPMDGGMVTFGGGSGKAFLGTVDNEVDTDHMVQDPFTVGGWPVQRIMGGTYDFKLGSKGILTGTYINLDRSASFGDIGIVSNGAPSTATRFNIYGADLSYNLGPATLEAGYGKSVVYGYNTTIQVVQPALEKVLDTKNARTNASLHHEAEKYSWNLAYQNIQENYFAPGDWGRIATYRNIRGYRSYAASGTAKVSKVMNLKGGYEKGYDNISPGYYVIWNAGFVCPISQKWKLDANYENTQWSNFQALAGAIQTRFATLNLGYDLGASTMMNLFVQNADIRNLINLGPGSQSGYFYGMQYSVKF